MPSMAPSHAGPAPMAARNAGSTAVAGSWLPTLDKLVRAHADAAQDRCAGEAVFAEHFDDGFMERFAVPFVGFADVDAHQGALTFKFLVGHGGSVGSDLPFVFG